MVLEMRGLLRPYGFLLNRDSVGGSVARARDAKVSMIRFTHNICTAFRGESWGNAAEIAIKKQYQCCSSESVFTHKNVALHNCSCSNCSPPHPHIQIHSSDLCDAGTSESHYDGHNVDSKLELKKFGDAVVDITAPHYCLDNAAEVIISQNDI